MQMFGMGMVTVQQSGDTIINRLKAAKTLIPDGGMPAKIIEGLINGQGLQSLMQNPLSAIQSQLTGQISNAISQLTGAGGMGSLISALGSGASGLQGALNGLVGQASSLLGLGGSGVTGLMNTIAQSGLSNLLSESGLNMSSIGLDKVLGPVLSGTKLSEISKELPTLITRVLGGQVTQASAVTTVNGHTASLNTITTASTAAISTVTAAAADIGAANAVGAVIMDNTTDPADEGGAADLDQARAAGQHRRGPERGDQIHERGPRAAAQTGGHAQRAEGARGLRRLAESRATAADGLLPGKLWSGMMRYRRLDKNGDYSFGQSRADFWHDVPDAVAQLVVTRFAMWQGEWWLDLADGTPYKTAVLGKYTSGTRDPVLRFRALDTPGVAELVSYSSDLNRDTRFFGVVMDVATVYGRIVIRGPI